jgi:3-dehydroquinate dehydratase-2
MTKVMIINGPNLNMLGIREPDIYGYQSLADIEEMCATRASELDFEIDFRQSNDEGTLVDWVQEAYKKEYNALIINAAAYTHTSLAIHDALKLLVCPVIEVHLSEPKNREKFRHFSYVELAAAHSFSGYGAQGYILALEKIKEVL